MFHMLCLFSPTGVTWLNPFITIEAGGKSGRLVVVVVGLAAELDGVGGFVGGAVCADTQEALKPNSRNTAAMTFFCDICFIVNVFQQIVTIRLFRTGC